MSAARSSSIAGLAGSQPSSTHRSEIRIPSARPSAAAFTAATGTPYTCEYKAATEDRGTRTKPPRAAWPGVPATTRPPAARPRRCRTTRHPAAPRARRTAACTPVPPPDRCPATVPTPGWPATPTTPRGSCPARARSEEHTSELQSPCNLVCRLLLEKKKQQQPYIRAANTTPGGCRVIHQPATSQSFDDLLLRLR